nr:CD177 antigen-like [Manis javanica]
MPSLRPAGQETEVGTREWKREADSWASKRQVWKGPPTPVQSPHPSALPSGLTPSPSVREVSSLLVPTSCRSAREETCPAGTTHCWNGELVFIGGGIRTSVSIQGCVPQEGCNLFKGTQHIGPLVMTENCLPRGKHAVDSS